MENQVRCQMTDINITIAESTDVEDFYMWGLCIGFRPGFGVWCNLRVWLKRIATRSDRLIPAACWKEDRFITWRGAGARARSPRGKERQPPTRWREQAGWNIRLDCCLEVLGWRSGPLCCRGRIQKRRPRLCNGRIARQQEGRSVGRVTGVWTQTWEKAGFDTWCKSPWSCGGFRWFPGW